MTERVPQVRPRSYQAHRMPFFGEHCPHHELGCPTTLDRIGVVIAWLVIGATIVYFGAHLLAAAMR